ncbi:MAG: DUF2871 family protein [Actinomycetaceae bacterium]|nr:DUF2871 family protein [Actinomycetaceae bacterium]
MIKDLGPATRTFAYLALGYTILGLVSGVAYRELTRGAEVVVKTQLSTLHTHILVLGLVMSLLFMLSEAVLHLSERKFFTAFLWVYNLGVMGVATMMAVTGLRQLWGHAEHPAIAGISGLFHITLTVGLILFFVVLLKALRNEK